DILERLGQEMLFECRAVGDECRPHFGITVVVSVTAAWPIEIGLLLYIVRVSRVCGYDVSDLRRAHDRCNTRSVVIVQSSRYILLLPTGRMRHLLKPFVNVLELACFRKDLIDLVSV